MIRVFSTKIKDGQGGISTALIGYIRYFQLNKIEYDTITTHSDNENNFMLALKAIKATFKVKKGDVCWFHLGPWVSMLRKLILIILCKIKGGEIITHFHSAKLYDYLNTSVGRKYISVFLSLSNKIIVVAPWWEELLSKAYPDYKDKIHYLFNPIDERLEVLAKEHKVKKNKPNLVYILSMSRLVEGKGFNEVIKSIANLPSNYILNIAGSGAIEGELKKLVVDLGLESRVNFLGWVGYEEKIQLLKEADIFCLPSKFDSFGMVYIEAMAANIPIVACNFQAIPDVVPEKFSVLVSSDDPIELAQAIKDVSGKMINERELSSQYVMDTYSFDIIGDKLLRIING